VASYFDTVDHCLLQRERQRPVADGDLLALVEQVLQAGGRWCGTGSGSAAGAASVLARTQ
jgi:hypothetical protein